MQLAAELKIDLEAEKVPVMPCLVVDDLTPEPLAAMLAEQGGRLALLSAEGGLFELAGGRYSDGVPNLDVFLKGHPGDDLRVDRIGRAPVHVRKPALTLGLVVQPDVIRDLARKPGFRGSGLLARFFFSLPQSLVGSRDVAPPAVPPDLTTTYSDLCTTLLTLPEQREDGELVRLVVRFDDAARRALEDFSRELESRLGAGGDLAAISDWAKQLMVTAPRCRPIGICRTRGADSRSLSCRRRRSHSSANCRRHLGISAERPLVAHDPRSGCFLRLQDDRRSSQSRNGTARYARGAARGGGGTQVWAVRA